MPHTIFQFGQAHPDHAIPVLNERAVRASAGILFFLALICFMNAWLTGNFQPTRVFVVSFLIEFTLRLFINPRFAPVMILGEWVVRKQQPEWVGAPQKRFAWAIGFVLAATMLYLVVLNHVVGPINLVVCALCLTLLFFETAFGICIGCKIYNWIRSDKAQLCPGGSCDMPSGQIPPMKLSQVILVAAFAVVVAGVVQWVDRTAPQRIAELAPALATPASATVDPAETERCKVPDFAKAMGHEEKWKLHNNCN